MKQANNETFHFHRRDCRCNAFLKFRWAFIEPSLLQFHLCGLQLIDSQLAAHLLYFLVLNYGYFGQIRPGLINLLNDRHERIVHDISEWEVTECDFNKDVKISDYFHMTALKVRIKHLDHLLGLYVKAMGHNTVLRVEETKRPNLMVADFITDIFNPTEKFRLEQLELRQRIDEIYDIVAKSLSGHSSPEDRKEVLNN